MMTTMQQRGSCLMKNEFYLHFENGMPKGTAQQKGERIKYRKIGTKMVPYIDHYRKPEVQEQRNQLIYMMKKYKPKTPSNRPIRLLVCLYFDIKQPKKLWGTYKTTRPDCDNYVKEIKDCMTEVGFWEDDAQVVDLHVIKRFAEKATIFIQMEELSDE